MFLCNSTIIPKKACDLVGLKYNQVMKVMLIAVATFAFTAAVWAQGYFDIGVSLTSAPGLDINALGITAVLDPQPIQPIVIGGETLTEVFRNGEEPASPPFAPISIIDYSSDDDAFIAAHDGLVGQNLFTSINVGEVDFAGVAIQNFSINTINFDATPPASDVLLNDPAVQRIGSVPEPSTWSLLVGGSGLFFILGWASKKGRQAKSYSQHGGSP
jgi:PEP-CTERM motif